MTRIPKQAVKAALEAWYTTPTDYVFETKADGDAKQMLAALTAALPHLLPAPSQSDEADAKALTISILSDCAMRFMEGPQPNIDRAIALGTKIALDALVAVRAGATAAEKERCAKWHDDRARQTPDAFEMEFHQVSAAAIRAGLTADDWLAAAIRGRKP